MSAAPRIPELPEAQKVRGAKVIGREAGIDRRTVIRRAQRGELMVKIDGQPRAVIYKDHKGYWAHPQYLAAWLAQQVQAVGANDIVPAG